MAQPSKDEVCCCSCAVGRRVAQTGVSTPAAVLLAGVLDDSIHQPLQCEAQGTKRAGWVSCSQSAEELSTVLPPALVLCVAAAVSCIRRLLVLPGHVYNSSCYTRYHTEHQGMDPTPKKPHLNVQHPSSCRLQPLKVLQLKAKLAESHAHGHQLPSGRRWRLLPSAPR